MRHTPFTFVLIVIVAIVAFVGAAEAIYRTNPISQLDEIRDAVAAGEYAAETPVMLDEVSQSADAADVEAPTGSPVYVSGGAAFLYVFDTQGGLAALEAMPDGGFEQRGSAALPTAPEDVASHGELLLVADSWAGLYLIDVSTPSSPTVTGSLATDSFARGVAATDSVAYVAEWDHGLRVVDIGRMAVPSTVATLAIDGVAHDVALSGNMLYVAAFDGGVHVLDVSDPTSPTPVARWATFPQAVAVSSVDGDVFVVDEQLGLQRVNAETHSVTGWWQTSGLAHRIDLSDNHVALSDLDGSVYVMDRDGSEVSPRLVHRGEVAATGLHVAEQQVMFADGISLSALEVSSSDE